MANVIKYVWGGMSRRKRLKENMMETPLKRCLTWWHLTFFGIGQMAGAGVYVLTGAVALTASGPATFIAYIIAGFCAFISALAFAEFGSRCPKAGSAYTYVYITIGEFTGFIIGWSLLLEHCIGAATTARAWGGAINALSEDRIRNWTITHIGTINIFGSSQYPDFFALLIVIILTVIVIYGAEESMSLNMIIAAVNMLAVVFVASVGFKLANIENWHKPDGFFPFGIKGIIRGAAMCFYAYVGYDGIANAGEEAKDPKKSLPIANALSICIVMIMYVIMSMSLTLTVPYDMIVESAPFAFAFTEHGLQWASTVVTIASLVAITGTTLGNLFAVPRCAYSMATDGLLYKCMAYVNPRTQTPLTATLAFSLVSALGALLLDLKVLAEMVSLGSLFAAFAVSGCVILLRYEPKTINPFESNDDSDETGKLKDSFKKISVLEKAESGKVPRLCTYIMAANFYIFSVIVVNGHGSISSGQWWGIILGLIAVLSGLVSAISFCILCMYVQNDTFSTYKVPLSPFLPALSMFVIAFLSVAMDSMAWMRFLIWMVFGSVIYFTYGIRNSEEANSLLSTKDSVIGYNTLPESTGCETEKTTSATSFLLSQEKNVHETEN